MFCFICLLPALFASNFFFLSRKIVLFSFSLPFNKRNQSLNENCCRLIGIAIYCKILQHSKVKNDCNNNFFFNSLHFFKQCVMQTEESRNKKAIGHKCKEWASYFCKCACRSNSTPSLKKLFQDRLKFINSAFVKLKWIFFLSYK